MTPEKAIERAIHALRTGQPNLAMTYMRRADQLLVEIREERERRRRKSMTLLEVFEEALREAAESWQSVADALVSAFSGVRRNLGS